MGMTCEGAARYTAGEVRLMLMPARKALELRTRSVFCPECSWWHVEFGDAQGSFRRYRVRDFLDLPLAKVLERDIFADSSWINTQTVLWRTLSRWKNNLRWMVNVGHDYAKDFSKAVEG